jgi:surfactin synthase thioesterase subunit
MTRLCDGLTAAIKSLPDDVPMAMFGHSMGARIAFEVSRRFEGRVVHLFASGSPAPGARPRYASPRDARPTAQLTDLELKQRLREMGGTPSQILANDDLMIRILPIVRADFTLIEQYRIEPQARISCPVTVFAGVDDPGAPPSAAAAWELRTSATCRMVELETGHFFLESHRASLASEIAMDLAARLV